VGERGETATYEQQDVLALRTLLRAGIRSDLGRIAAGAPLPALGEGPVCDFCAARGLCRKDFWQ
jgi:ATP-dependent helicase/nuclease subunit B